METDVDSRSFDVLVLAGPGTGHYHPIAGLLAHLADHARIAITAQVPTDHPMVAKATEDGFTFLTWPDEANSAGGRLLGRVRRRVQQRVVPRLAASGDPDAELPSVACRTAFALSSLLSPLSDASPERGAAIDELLRRTRPRLVLTEGNEDWMEALAAHHGVTWAYYTTGPVSTIAAGRPVGPAGFAPTLEGAKAANTLLLMSKRVRRTLRLRRIDRAAAQRFGASRTRAPLAKFAFSVPELDAYPDVPGHDVEYAGLFPYRPPTWWGPSMTESVDVAGRDTVLVTGGSGGSASDDALSEALIPVLVELSAELRVVVISGDSRLGAAVAGHDGLHALAPSDTPPYDELRRSRLVITHGGYGTIKEAVALGAAVLVLPEVVADRMETSQRVCTSGVGRSVNRNVVDSDHLRHAVRVLLDDPLVRASVDRVGAALRTPPTDSGLFRRLEQASRANG